MTDELRFEVIAEEGERHPSDGHALREILRAMRLLLDSQALIQQHQRVQIQLLHEILEREPKPTYFQPTGGSVTVTP